MLRPLIAIDVSRLFLEGLTADWRGRKGLVASPSLSDSDEVIRGHFVRCQYWASWTTRKVAMGLVRIWYAIFLHIDINFSAEKFIELMHLLHTISLSPFPRLQ